MDLLSAILLSSRSYFLDSNQLVLENLAIRQQLLVLQRTMKRPRLRRRDRIFWIFLARFWRDWRRHIFLVWPETVVRWHREGFKYYWRWKSYAGRRGRPLSIVVLLPRPVPRPEADCPLQRHATADLGMDHAGNHRRLPGRWKRSEIFGS